MLFPVKLSTPQRGSEIRIYCLLRRKKKQLKISFIVKSMTFFFFFPICLNASDHDPERKNIGKESGILFSSESN